MDMNKMMKQVQKMQAELAKAQEELALAVVEGSSGGGAVKVEFTGNEVSKVSIVGAGMRTTPGVSVLPTMPRMS